MVKTGLDLLVAYGYLAGRNTRAAPVEIPERFLEPKFIKGDSELISAPPHEFTSVRVPASGLFSWRRKKVRIKNAETSIHTLGARKRVSRIPLRGYKLPLPLHWRLQER